MPRFYINFRNGDEIAQDREGTELPSLEAAKELAMNSARELLADSVKTGSNPTTTAAGRANPSNLPVVLLRG